MLTVEVYAASSLADAHLLQIFLEQSGIAAQVVGPLNQGAHAGFPAESESIPTVRVAISDEARARDSVGGWKQQRRARAASAPPDRWNSSSRMIGVSNQPMVEVYWARDAQDAHSIAGLLKAEGIHADVLGELSVGATDGSVFTPANSPRVWVTASDEQRALAVIAAGQASRDDEGQPWTCGQCGEPVEGNFDICWNCESPRP